MSGQIRISPEQMRGRAGEVRGQRDAFEEVTGRMKSIIDVLQGEWEGQASRQFAEQFAGLRPSFDQMRDLMDNLARQLDSTAAALEQLDQEIASKFR